ncbi:hypothetical protein HPB47_016115 [Ixodes persulcatus]|uniref:Uncharacterized protein n=1 Tax=Ixodes persulcatus TaxID=34615 RepID=A0AC60QSK8_IXOPE|nr:hypothetical protein HPB47_016115 [Ixodes persulcatus]
MLRKNAAAQRYQGKRAPPGSPWPAPQAWKTSPLQRTLDPESFILTSDAAEECDVVSKALARYHKLVFVNRPMSVDNETLKNLLPALRVQVDKYKEEHCLYPQHKDDESCAFTLLLVFSLGFRNTA